MFWGWLMGRDDRIVHAVEKKSGPFELLEGFLKAYKARTEVLANQGDNTRFDAIIEMLRSSAGVPAELGFVKEELKLIHGLLVNPQPKLLEVRFVFKVKDDHQDESFSISIGNVTDAEGHTIPDPAGLKVAVQSSDESVVSVTFDEASKSGSVSFGAPGVASLTASVTNANGDILGSGAADFTVTTGDPAAVSDVKLAFSGLTEEAPAGGETGGGTEGRTRR